MAAEPAATCRLVIDYGDGVEKHFSQLAWRDGLTVQDLLNTAAKHPRGIKFEFRGQGETAILTQLDGVKNEGSGRNWIYQVNGKFGDRSFAIQKLSAGDNVLWKFGEYR